MYIWDFVNKYFATIAILAMKDFLSYAEAAKARTCTVASRA